MIGKAERGPVAIEAIRKHKSAYLMAVGGAAYLVAKAIKSARVIAFADLAWKRFTSLTYEICRSQSPSVPTAPRCITPARASGNRGSARSPLLWPEIEVRPAMQRIVVFGSGSGKTTLGRWLSGQFDLPFADLTMCTGDRDGLKVRSLNSKQRSPILLAASAGSPATTARCAIYWPRADTLVWLDLPLMQVLWNDSSRIARQSWTGEAILQRQPADFGGAC